MDFTRLKHFSGFLFKLQSNYENAISSFFELNRARPRAAARLPEQLWRSSPGSGITGVGLRAHSSVEHDTVSILAGFGRRGAHRRCSATSGGGTEGVGDDESSTGRPRKGAEWSTSTGGPRRMLTVSPRERRMAG